MKWWQDEQILKEVIPSPAERRIIKYLQSIKVQYFREVCFRGLNSEKNYPLRFDFYFPHKNLLIEYDGIHHRKKSVKVHDQVKNEFAKVQGIALVRLNKSNWKNLEGKLNRVMIKYGLIPKPPIKKRRSRNQIKITY